MKRAMIFLLVIGLGCQPVAAQQEHALPEDVLTPLRRAAQAYQPPERKPPPYEPADYVLRLFSGEGIHQDNTPERQMLLIGLRFGLAKTCAPQDVDHTDLWDVKTPEEIALFVQGVHESNRFLLAHQCHGFMRIEATRRLDDLRALP